MRIIWKDSKPVRKNNSNKETKIKETDDKNKSVCYKKEEALS